MDENKIYLGNFDMFKLLGFEECNIKKCDKPKVHNLDYCWEHLNEEQQNNIRNSLVENKKNLKYIRLAYVDLSGLDFSDGNLSQGFLLGCNLTDCNFSNASMLKTDLSSSEGKNINFNKAKLNSCNLSNTNFFKVDFMQSVLASAYAYDAKIIDSNFMSVLANGSTFRKCDLSYSNFEKAKLVDCNFRESILEYCNFNNTNIEFSQFSLTNLSNAKFINTKIFGLSPWGVETNNTEFTNLIRNFNNKSNLPMFLYPESENKATSRYILKLNIYNKLASVESITQKLKIINQIFTSKIIWKEINPPKLMITTIDRGSVEIKMIIDLAKEYLPYVNDSLLTTTIFFAFGIKFILNSTLEITKKTVDIYIHYKKFKREEKKYQLENSTIQELIEFNKKKEDILKELQRKDIQLNAKIETIDTVLKDLIPLKKTQEIFKGIQYIEVLYPKSDDFKEAYIIRINESGEIKLLDIEHYIHKE